MKLLMLLITVISLVFGNNTVPAPDFNPKQLHSNLKKITGCENYHKEELAIPNPDSFGSIEGKFFRVTCSTGIQYFVYVGRVNSCRASGCSINRPNGEFEFFDYLTIYDSSYSVLQVHVYNYEATHGHGITARGWLKQFIGYRSGATLQSGKNIDAISGATISVNGIIEDIKEKTEMLQDLSGNKNHVLSNKQVK